MGRIEALRSRLEPLGLLVLRLAVGVVMVGHGVKKLTNLDEWIGNLAGMGIPAPKVSIWLAIAGELGGGLGVLVGALTPIAALGIASSMLTAIVFVHLKHGLFGENGGFEYPLTMLAAAIFLAVHGAGPWSVDAGWRRRRARS